MSARKVLLINPPFPWDRDFIDYPYFTGLGVLANAAALREKGFSVSVADAQSAGPQSPGWVGCGLDRLLAGAAPDCPTVAVAVPPFLRPQARTAFAAKLFRTVSQRLSPERLVAADFYFGGMHHVEYDADAFLRRHPEVDAVVKYEAEAALPAWLRRPSGSAPRVVLGAASDVVPDDLPFPAWDLIDVGRYYEFQRGFFAAHGRLDPYDPKPPTLPALTSRGCPHRCAFCTANPGAGGPLFRPHSPAYLARHFAELKRRFGARRLVLLDGCANHDADRFAEVLAVIRGLGLRCEFPNGLRADRLTWTALRTLSRLCESVSISAESGDAGFLSRQVGKGLDLTAVPRVADWCRRLGLPLSIHYLIGCPGETAAQVNRTLAHALRMQERYGARPLVQNFVPIPGSRWHADCRRGGLLRHFDAAKLYGYFHGRPAIAAAGLSRPKLARMAELFRRRSKATALEKVIINLTYECGNACRFCAVGDRPRRHGSFRRYARLLREYRRRGVAALDLDGGEPTRHPRFLEVVRLAHGLGYERISVTTNGRRLAERSFAARFLLSGISHVMISLHGPTPRIHDALTRRQGSFQETVAGIRHATRLKPGRVTLAVNTLLTQANAPHIRKLLALVHRLGVRQVNIQFVTPFGRAATAAPQDSRSIWRHLAPAWKAWRGRLDLALVNAVPCQVPAGLPGWAPDVGKHGRDMVFVNAPRRNLAAYLDRRRRKTAACAACEHAVACAGFYEPPDAR